ncbi:MAG TPA: hypothetical protein ACFYD3_07605 [Candidatus Hypogeohydataceae bacterium YC41]
MTNCKNMVLAICVLVFLFQSCGDISKANACDKPYPRAVWVWGAKELVIDAQVGDYFISFCKAKCITRAFLSLDRTLLSTLPPEPALISFVTKCHLNGIIVSTLFGEAKWVYPQYRQNMLDRIQSVLTYNSNNSTEARFDGIHLDIEPHTLPEWDTNKVVLLGLLADTYAAANQAMSSQPGLQLEVDVPVFYDKVDISTFTRIVDTVDVLTVMAYARKTVNSVVNAVSVEIATANDEHKSVIVGFNAKDFLKEAELETLIVGVGNRLSSNPSFSGFSIHDFDDYKMLVGM